MRHCKSGPKSPDSGPLPHYSFCILVVLFSFRPAEITDFKCVEALHIPIALAVLYTDS